MELVSRMQAKTVTVNCVHPGVHRTKVLNDGWGSGVGDVKVTYSHMQHLSMYEHV